MPMRCRELKTQFDLALASRHSDTGRNLTVRREFDGVLHEIAQHLTQPDSVTRQGRPTRRRVS